MQNRTYILTVVALLCVLVQGNYCFAQGKAFVIDTERSNISFTVKHLGVLNVKGVFENYSGYVFFENQDLKEIGSTIIVNSIDTFNKSRDKTLLSDSYFDAEAYPFITFKSTYVTENSINGILKIKSVEREIKVSYFLDGNKIRMTTTINRAHFKLHFGTMNGLIGDDIKIEISLYLKPK